MTRSARCGFLLVFTVGLCLSFSVAQSKATPAQATPSQQSPQGTVATLHTSAKLVVVDVVVRDRNGKPIHGLTRNDFALSEGGKLQTLSSFEEYSRPTSPPAIPAMPQLPSGMFTNFTPVAAKGPLNVLLIDGINSLVTDQAYFRQQLLNYIDHIPPGTRIAIFGMADHLYLLEGFTSDPRVLRAALSSMRANPHAAVAGTAGTDRASLMDALTDPSGGPANGSISMSAGQSALMTSAVDTFLDHVSTIQKAMQIRLTLNEMTQLGRWLLNFPGRKNILWASTSFPLGSGATSDLPSEDSNIFVRMLNTFAEAQVAVYPIDPGGLSPEPVFQAAYSPANHRLPDVVAETAASSSQRASEQATMQAFSSDTGGAPFYNRNNLTQAIGDAIESGANYYTLSYSPNEKKTGGEWRSIHVDLANPAYKAAQLSYRRGYYADNLKVPAYNTGTAEVTEDPNAPSVESSRNAHLAMLHGAPTQQDIPFTTRVLPASTSTEDQVPPDNGPDPKNPMKPPYRRYDIDCAAAARYFTLAQRPDGHRVGAIQAAVFVYDPTGKLLNTVSRTLHFDLTPQEYAEFQRLGYREHLEVSAPAKGESFFRIGVEERISGRIGSVEVASSAVSNLPPPEYAHTPGRPPTGAKTAPDSSLHP